MGKKSVKSKSRSYNTHFSSFNGSEQSVKEAVELLESFGDASGLKLSDNSSKPEAFSYGSAPKRPAR